MDPRDTKGIAELNAADEPHLITVKDGLGMPVIAAFRLLAARITAPHPILLKDTLTPSQDAQRPFLDTLLESSVNIGSLLCDGIGDAILVQGEEAPGQSLRLSFNILQAAGARIFKTDYVACPSCGRTLFDLQSTTAKIKASTLHLKGVKIAIMGCIVNGPGEMADADFGYVGGAPGKSEPLRGQAGREVQHPRGRSRGPPEGSHPRARQMGRARACRRGGVAACPLSARSPGFPPGSPSCAPRPAGGWH